MKFADKIYEIVSSKNALYDKADEITSRLKRSMELTAENLEQAITHNISWDVGEYRIYVESRLGRYWRIVLEIVPKYIAEQVGPDGVGWKNVPHSPFPDGWTYKPEGTRTIVLPPKEVVDEVVKLIDSGSDGKN